MTYADRYGLIDLVHYRGSDCLGDTPLSAFLLQISRTEPPEFAAAIRVIRRHVLAGRWEAAEAHAVALVTGGGRRRSRTLSSPSRRRRLPCPGPMGVDHEDDHRAHLQPASIAGVPDDAPAPPGGGPTVRPRGPP